MAYGLDIKNKFGDVVLDSTEQHMYEHSTGVTKDLNALLLDGDNAATAAGWSLATFGVRHTVFGAGLYTTEQRGGTQITSPVGTFTDVGAGAVLTHPTFTLVPGDLVFYDVSTQGILDSQLLFSDGYTDTTPNGVGYGAVTTELGTPINYTVLSSRKPVAAPTEAYGLKLFNASGVETFDSRQPQFTIFDHFYVSQTIITLLLIGAGPFDLHLSEAHANYRVALPSHLSFESWTGGYVSRIMVKKLDASTLRISLRSNGGSKTGTSRVYALDTAIILGA